MKQKTLTNERERLWVFSAINQQKKMLPEYPMPFSYSFQFMKHHYTTTPYHLLCKVKQYASSPGYTAEYLHIPVELASLTSPPTLPLSLLYAAAGSAAGS